MSSGVRKGEPWGRPASEPPDIEAIGDDADLAAVATRSSGARVLFRPSEGSDLARALGLDTAGAGSHATEVPVDGLRWAHGIAVNALVLGTPPDRMRWWKRTRRVNVRVDGRQRFAGGAVTVVVANGQYLRGADLVPRGHPGDGRLEVQVYSLQPGERRAMRRRLPGAQHLPHPRIHELSGRRVQVAVAGHSMALEADGRRRGRTDRLDVEVVPGVVSVLV